jgi:hypothetical protein
VITIVQTVPNTGEFDASPDNGLLDFEQMVNTAGWTSDPNRIPIILAITLQTSPGDAFPFDCFLAAPDSLLTTRRHTIANSIVPASGFNLVPCRIYVPRTMEGGVLSTWQLGVVAANTEIASLVVTFTFGPAPGGTAF